MCYCQVDRDSAKTAEDKATEIREKEHAEFLKESGETKSYISALSKAKEAKSAIKLYRTWWDVLAHEHHRANGRSIQVAHDLERTIKGFLLAGGPFATWRMLVQ